MSTSNEELFHALVRHQIYLMRFSGGLTKKLVSLLDKTEQALSDKIIARLGSTAETGLIRPLDVQKMNVLLGIVRRLRASAWDKIDKEWEKELVALAVAEPDFLNKIILTTSPMVVETIVPSVAALEAIVRKSPFSGRTLREWAKALRQEDIRRVETAIRVGMVAGETGRQIAQRVVGTASANGINGITELSRNQVNSVVRTAVNFLSNETRAAFMQENKDLAMKEMFVATLDGRTTARCRSLDGQLFEVGRGPRPPLHFNCRSTRVPVLDGVILGQRPFKAVTERELVKEFAQKKNLKGVSVRSELPFGTKKEFDAFARARAAELTGQVPATTNYQAWLSGQSKGFQDEILGKTKAKLFRDGQLTLDKFVNRNGDELTLPELAQKHAEAFEAAGLDPKLFVK